MHNSSSPYHVISDDNSWIGLANIHLTGLPQKLSFEGEELLQKTEFHITLMAVKYLAPMLDIADEKARETLRNDFLEFAKTHDVTQFELTGEYMVVQRNERTTIVAMVNMPEIHVLFDYLRNKHNISFPTQPAHITLYTRQPDAGIWLLSDEEVQRDGKPIVTNDLSYLSLQSIEK